jgi:hypothetical protein
MKIFKEKKPQMELIPIIAGNYDRISWPLPHGTSFKLVKDKKYNVTKFIEMGPLSKEWMEKNNYRRIYYLQGDDLLKYYVNKAEPLPFKIETKLMYEIVGRDAVPRELRKEVMTAYVVDSLGRILKPKTREHFRDIFNELS